ncbi:MAG TPA: rhomboid family intramembrane serine protease [Candidatus Acidoferrum sp.]
MPLPYQWQYRLDRWKNSLRGLFGGGGNQNPRPQICPACGSLVGINATRCHNCGTNLRFSMAKVSKGLSELFGGHAPVTTILLIVNVIMFAVEFMAMAAHGQGGGLTIVWGMGGESAYRLGASFPFSIFVMHEWYRLITATYLHGGLIHIGFNMMVLMDIGPVVEELYGSARYFFLYTVTGAVGFLVSAYATHFSLGASAPILGLVGLMLAVTTKRTGLQVQQLRARLISWVVTLFVIGLMPGLSVDNWAHGGGFAAGFLLGRIFADHEPRTASELRVAQALGFLTAVVVVSSFVLMILHYNDRLPGS